MNPHRAALAHNERFHLRLGQRRTTVTLDTMIASYLAVHLGCTPETPLAHQTVRCWLQQRLDEHNDLGRSAVSQWLKREALEAIVDTHVSTAYTHWLLNGPPPTSPGLDPS